MNNILEVKNLKKYFKIERGLLKKGVGEIKAVDDISFSVEKGQILGLVGESGSGKTTCAKLILNLLKADSGTIKINGIDMQGIKAKEKRERIKLRKSTQFIFQDPYESLNPRMRVSDIILEGVAIYGLIPRNKRDKRLNELLNLVGLPVSAKHKYPHQFSGGERQRIGIARALSTEPELIICDEPVSSLDVSIRAQILNLLKDLRTEFKLSYLFISHDLSVVRYMADKVCVMHEGRIVEAGPANQVYENPEHPYTKKLLSAVLKAEPSHR